MATASETNPGPNGSNPARTRVLRVDASGRRAGSVARMFTDDLMARLPALHGELEVTNRDLAPGLSFVDEAWVASNFTPEEERTDAQREAALEEARAGIEALSIAAAAPAA